VLFKTLSSSYTYYSDSVLIGFTDELEAELLVKKAEMESLGEETTRLRTEVHTNTSIYE